KCLVECLGAPAYPSRTFPCISVLYALPTIDQVQSDVPKKNHYFHWLIRFSGWQPCFQIHNIELFVADDIHYGPIWVQPKKANIRPDLERRKLGRPSVFEALLNGLSRSQYLSAWVKIAERGRQLKGGQGDIAYKCQLPNRIIIAWQQRGLSRGTKNVTATDPHKRIVLICNHHS